MIGNLIPPTGQCSLDDRILLVPLRSNPGSELLDALMTLFHRETRIRAVFPGSRPERAQLDGCQLGEDDGVTSPVEEVRRLAQEGTDKALGNPEDRWASHDFRPFRTAQVEGIEHRVLSAIGIKGVVEAHDHHRPARRAVDLSLDLAEDVGGDQVDVDDMDWRARHGVAQDPDESIARRGAVADSEIHREAVGAGEAAPEGAQALPCGVSGRERTGGVSGRQG